MREIGHVARAGGGVSRGVHPLQDEPGTEHQPGRDAHRDEEQERHQRPHLRPRVEHEVGAEHTGDRAGRPDERLNRGPVREREPVSRDIAAEHVEKQVGEPAEAVLDVVAEDDEEQHVPEQVQPARVQEHGEQHRQRRRLVVRRRAHVARAGRRARPAGHDPRQLMIGDQLARDRRVAVVERLLSAELGLAGHAGDGGLRPGGEQQHDDVRGHQEVGDPGGTANGVDVMERDHHASTVRRTLPALRCSTCGFSTFRCAGSKPGITRALPGLLPEAGQSRQISRRIPCSTASVSAGGSASVTRRFRTFQ